MGDDRYLKAGGRSTPRAGAYGADDEVVDVPPDVPGSVTVTVSVCVTVVVTVVGTVTVTGSDATD